LERKHNAIYSAIKKRVPILGVVRIAKRQFLQAFFFLVPNYSSPSYRFGLVYRATVLSDFSVHGGM